MQTAIISAFPAIHDLVCPSIRLELLCLVCHNAAKNGFTLNKQGIDMDGIGKELGKVDAEVFVTPSQTTVLLLTQVSHS